MSLAPWDHTDAYLAALAMANGWRLVSVDRNFERFHGLQRLLLPKPLLQSMAADLRPYPDQGGVLWPPR